MPRFPSILILLLLCLTIVGYAQPLVCRHTFSCNAVPIGGSATTGFDLFLQYSNCEDESRSRRVTCSNNSNQCKEQCSAGCSQTQYVGFRGSVSWYDNCIDSYVTRIYECNNCGVPLPTPTPTPTPPSCRVSGDFCVSGSQCCSGQCDEFNTCNTCSPCEGDCGAGPNQLLKQRPLEDSLRSSPGGCCSDYERLTCFQGGGEWYESQCACYSPIVIDAAGNGFNLTSAEGGVIFDIPGDGMSEQISWTAADSDDAWLALDRNGNGLVDSGKELFGSSTQQHLVAHGESKNGFRALAVFDEPEHGGNSDGRIDSRDKIFAHLKLWQDRNHNGISEPTELQYLSASVIRVIELNYKESRRGDENGNWFRYRAKVKDVHGAQAGRWAWDVFLQKPQ